MALIEFSLTPRLFFDAKAKWASEGKTPEEISILTTKLLHERAAAREASGDSGGMTKFPPWCRDFLRQQIDSFSKGSKLKFDPENDTLTAHVNADVLEAGDWIGGDFTKAWVEITADKDEFNKEYHLRAKPLDTDGEAEMADLENHFRSAAKEGPKGKQQDEPVDDDDDGPTSGGDEDDD